MTDRLEEYRKQKAFEIPYDHDICPTCGQRRMFDQGYNPCMCDTARYRGDEVPKRYANVLAANARPQPKSEEQKVAFAAARQFYNDYTTTRKARSIYLCGRPETGKTFVAMMLARFLQSKGVWVACFEVPTLLFDSKASVGAGGFPALVESVDDRLTRANVVVLDDIGKGGTLSEFELQLIEHIIRRCDNDMLPMILTSNFRLADLAKQLDEQLVSRIRSGGTIEVVLKANVGLRSRKEHAA